MVFPGRAPWPQASPEMRCGVGALLSRLLKDGVVGVMMSEVLRFPVLEASATPDGSLRGYTAKYNKQKTSKTEYYER